MKLLKYRKLENTTIKTVRKVQSDDGRCIGLIGKAEDLLSLNIINGLPEYCNPWSWIFISADGKKLECFEEHEEIIDYLKSLKPMFGEAVTA